MKKRDIKRAGQLESALLAFSRDIHPLPGISRNESRQTLVLQFLASIHRVEYIRAIQERPINPNRTNPRHSLFDPLKAAILLQRAGEIEEACWLIFLVTHFGRHRNSKWQLVQNIYGAPSLPAPWGWKRISKDPDGISRWLSKDYENLKQANKLGYFGNHRKYETLNPDSENSTGLVIASYVNWVLQYGSHSQLFSQAALNSKDNPRKMFRYLYEQMNVHRFGRTAKFDYLTMLGKLHLAPIVADSGYLAKSTGPMKGAKLLLGGTIQSTRPSVAELEKQIIKLAEVLQIGMQEMEDALCNWQKNPNEFIHFIG